MIKRNPVYAARMLRDSLVGNEKRLDDEYEYTKYYKQFINDALGGRHKNSDTNQDNKTYNGTKDTEHLTSPKGSKEVPDVAEQEKIYDWIKKDIEASEARQRAMEERMDAQMGRIEATLEKIEDKIGSQVKHVQVLTTTTVIGIVAAVLAVAAIAVTIILSLPWQ